MVQLKKIMMVMLLLGTKTSYAQNTLTDALDAWRNGDIKEAHELALSAVNESKNSNEAKHLLMKTFFVQGDYKKSLTTFNEIDKRYKKHKECADLAIQTNIHLKNYDAAITLAALNKSKSAAYLMEFKNRPFTVIADKTYYVAFLNDAELPSDYWPGVTGSINGVSSSFRFDTGGDFMVIGVNAAQKLGVKLTHKTKKMHGATSVTTWHSIIDSMSFDNGPSFKNVPVTVLTSLGDYIIFGTNMLEPFLTTVDYNDNQFVFTPRGYKLLIEEHYEMLPKNNRKVLFYLWDDHFMFAKGKLGENDSINLFFDSGLIMLNEIDGQLVQASFTASKESLLKWGIGKNQLKKNSFIATDKSLSVNDLVQQNTYIWYDNKLKKDRNFGGILIDGLISHAWLKNYTWTIDFDKMEYTFGLK